MKILLSYDGKHAAQEALDFGISHAKKLDAGLDIVTVVIRKSTDQSDDIDGAEKILEKARKACSDKGLTCKTKLIIRKQDAGEAVLEYANENGYELLIVGIEKTSKVGKLFLGSVAQHIILNASCPVLTVGKNKWL